MHQKWAFGEQKDESRVKLHFWCILNCSNAHCWCIFEVVLCTKSALTKQIHFQVGGEVVLSALDRLLHPDITHEYYTRNTKMNVACLFILMKNLLVVKFSEWQFSVRPLNGLAQVWQKCEVWSFFMATWRHHYDIIIMTSSSLRHHQLRRYLYNTLERMSTRREQIDLDHVLVNGDRRDWRDEIIKSTMPAACKRISNTENDVIGGYKIRVEI